METPIAQLETIISAHINSNFPEVPPSEEEFDVIVSLLRQSLDSVCHVSDIEFNELRRKLKANIVVKMDIGIAIKNKDQAHHSWLPSRRSELDFFFWKRYETYLGEVKKWNPRIIGALGRVSDEIVDLLGDPQSQDAFQRRGLVLGDVQSGKTANYTAICNKAADTGYRIIIVLAGMMENLRQQTQGRLDTEFSGRKSEYFLDPQKKILNCSFGVGRYGSEKRIASFTSVVKDFNINILKSQNLSLLSVHDPVLFVVKKNKRILNNLIRWFKTNNVINGQKINLPLLLIDDEADNASVNTKQTGGDPTAINKAIRTLLSLFKQASYLGITATPYANIFINPETQDDMIGDDLFPRDFIYSLAPPTNYIGATDIFGDDAPYKSCLEPIYPEEINAFFPIKHTKNYQVPDLPPSLKEAMAYFLLVNGIRDLRGDNKTHRSMMIHISRFTNVQNQIRDLAMEWLSQIRSDLQNYSCLAEEKSYMIPNIKFLKTVWTKYQLNEKVNENDGNIISWHEFLSIYLYKAVAPVEIRSVNQSSGSTSLDYFNHREDGLRVIAIGGNSLSRGLTLEGLCVSYFYRKTLMYDTLLQMGRWFGYRPGYEDLFKIWICSEAIDWYGFITSASEELKFEIASMRNANLTPKEFGLKVRQDPSSLIATARNKMRTATMISRPVTVSGRLLETPRLKADKQSLEDNESVFKNFVHQLDDIGHRCIKENARFYWEGIDKEDVAQLLCEFKTHLWHLSFQGPALAEYIRLNMDNVLWDVVIAEGSDDNFELSCGDKILNIKPEKRTIIATSSQISISGTKVRVGTGGAARLGLSKKQREQAEEKFKQLHPGKKHVPDSAYLIKDRPPLLMLHVISVDRTTIDEKTGNIKSQIEEGCQVPNYLYALGVGFPFTGEEEKTANYVVNLVELNNYYNADEENDE
ncbi:MAG: Z1 domain-containing protein [Spirochaetia bacterium]|jgi:hypothetical protein|nr:Z1 domain-containing protein [Spirochaetia bacterium]